MISTFNNIIYKYLLMACSAQEKYIDKLQIGGLTTTEITAQCYIRIMLRYLLVLEFNSRIVQ